MKTGLALALVLTLLGGCSGLNQQIHVGKTFEHYCETPSFPATCSYNTKEHKVDWSLDRTESGYRCEGVGAFQSLNAANVVQIQGYYLLMLIKDNTCVHEVRMAPRMSGNKMVFGKSFSYEEAFDGILLDYRWKVLYQ